MHTFSDIQKLRHQISTWRDKGKSIALVPTMGHLHEGHFSLIDIAKSHADIVIVSIFINPTQFNQSKDFEQYPRTLSSDLDSVKNLHIDAVFTPEEKDIYPNGPSNAPLIHIPELSEHFCGKFRPGHFDGVCTVVAKLFNIISPDIAVFGEKDYQQLLIIRRLIEEFHFNITIIAGQTIRDDRGLALSSRNSHLTSNEKNVASTLINVLNNTKAEFSADSIEHLENQAIQQLENASLKVEYFSIRDARNLKSITKSTENVVILSAIWLRDIRLIDNLLFPLP